MRRDSRNETLCHRVGLTIRISVTLFFTISLVGLILLLVSSPQGNIPAGSPLTHYPGVPLALLNAGIVILLFTPIAVLLATAKSFLPTERRWAILCLAIICLFILGFFLARFD